MKRTLTLPVLMAALIMLAGAIPVRAAVPEPTTIVTWICAEFEGGEWRVPRRSAVTMSYSWATKNRRQIVKFLDRSHVDLTIDGAPVANADLLWSLPYEQPGNPAGNWAVDWNYDIGRLGPANSVDVNFKLTFSQAHWDGFDLYPAGLTEDSDCRVFTRGA